MEYVMLLGACLVDEIVFSDGQWNRALDDTFGPSPEERARQEQQQGEVGGN
ncbi:hypothetical protein [Streptomyces sp. NPDC088766]|uniref:hypothetical protein n=1 Tax=Streptomyces sp. NPDC088766 TaxID=3365893 RepID=UPI0038220DE2